MKYENIPKLMNMQSTPGSPVANERPTQIGLSITAYRSVYAPPMCEFSVQMDDGTEISGRFPNKDALRDALEMIMNELERMP